MNLSDAERLFHEALTQASPAERASFLDGACGGDSALRERVQRLLDAHEQTVSLLPEDPLRAGPALRPAEDAGSIIGRYKLLQQIGEGGMGVVYMAEQEEPVRRRVALKIIKRGMDTRAVIARFEAERQALAMMDHPNIARVLDGGATETGRPYFVMELVQGVPITEYCDKNRLPAADRLKLFVAVCQAIQSAHQKGIIHRDIKPSNVLVTLEHGEPMPKVIDFGIAKATNQKLTEKTLFTNYATMIGTPAYMSPEQAEMTSLDIDTRADIYSLGVLLYELLTGTTPFQAERLRSLGYGEMQRVIVEEEPERPSTRLGTLTAEQKTAVARNRGNDVQALGALLRGDLDWVVMRCLEKDRRRRYETANALAADLQRHLANEPVTARPPSVAYRLRKAISRNRFAFATAGGISLAVVLGLALSVWQAIRATRAERAEARLRGQAERAVQREVASRQSAVVARNEAEAARGRAEEMAEGRRRETYAAEMRAAQIALESGNLGQCRALLLKQRSMPGDRTVDLRGFEWRYLWQSSRSEAELTLYGDGPVLSTALSPDGRLVATLESPRQLVVRELPSGATVHRGNREGGKVLDAGGVCFSPDGMALAYTSEASIRIIHVGDWTERNRLEATEVLDLRYSPDSRFLGAVTRGSACLWATTPQGGFTERTELAIPEFARLRRQLNGLAWSRDGSLVFVGDLFSGVFVVDASTRAMKASLSELSIKALAVAPDGGLLAGASWDGRLCLWTQPDFRPVALQSVAPAFVLGLHFLDSQTLVTGGADQWIKFWRIPSQPNPSMSITLEQTRQLRGHEKGITSITSAGDRIVSGSWDGSTRVWARGASPAPLRRFEPPKGEKILDCPGLGFSQDGQQAWGISARSGFLVWDLQQGGAPRERLPLPPDLDAGADPSAWMAVVLGSVWYGDEYFYRSRDGTLSGYNPRSRRHVRLSTMPEPGMAIRGVLDYRGKTLLITGKSGQGDQSIGPFARSTRTGEAEMGVLEEFLSRGGDLDDPFEQTLAQSPDRSFIALEDGDGKIAIWDASQERLHARLESGHQVYSMAFSRDGTRLVAGFKDGTVKAWDVRSATALTPALRGSLAGVWSVGFSPDGATLLATGDDRCTRMFSLHSGQEMVVLQDCHLGRGAIDPTGRWVVLWSGAYDETGYAASLQIPSLDEIEREIASLPGR